MPPLLRETEGPMKSQPARKLTKLTHDKWHEKVDFLNSPFLRGNKGSLCLRTKIFHWHMNEDDGNL
jgi:hypothetical protein